MKIGIKSKNSVVRGLFICFILAATILSLLASRHTSASSPRTVSVDGVWYDVPETAIPLQGERWIIPNQYRTVALQADALATILAAAPLEFTAAAQTEAVILTLPLPNGDFGRFRILESPVMAPELAAKFPQIKTYVGQGIDDTTATVRLDHTPAGFHAMILSTNGTIYIDPYSRNDVTHYISYFTRDYTRETGFVELGPVGDNAEVEALVETLQASGGSIPSGDEIRIYRLALATTGEYTIFHGGTVEDGMAAVVTAVNRVTGIYERDVAIRMELIPNNDLLIYTDPATDPYTNNSGGAMLGQNQTTIDAVIGDTFYDIGHVFSTGGGGVASLGVPCQSGIKARGVTGLPAPIGDPFYVDYVAHEMGHQYGGNHTFNGNSGSCAGSQWHGPTAYEPGSGTTIMAYAGICAPQNIQPNSDDHFHTGSIDEIRAYTVLGPGDSCPVIYPTGNTAPTVDAGNDYTIPLDTPFVLTGSAADAQGHPLTYNWEQFDTGPTGHPDAPVGNAPLFRSFSSAPVPWRTFPQLSDIVNNVHTLGELLPTYARTMTFRLTVRDNQVAYSAGGVNVDMVTLNVTDTAGPFLVTAPNTAVTWTVSDTEMVTWDVANTDMAPINCAEVDISLSLDGGYTYPTTVETNRPNDGSEAITVPNVGTTAARVRVQCSDNVFFDISDTDFTIQGGYPSINIDKSVTPEETLGAGDALTYTITISNTGPVTGTTVVTDVFDAHLVNPVCDGVPGDLNDSTSINGLSQSVYTCAAQVDPTAAVDLALTADPISVEVGLPVTYTFTITNPNPSITLTNVVVTGTHLTGCTPALGPAMDLTPLATQTYVCPNITISSSVTATVTIWGSFDISNQASASASGDPGGLQVSNVVTTSVLLTESDMVTVTAVEPPPGPTYSYLYLPFVRNE